VGDIEFLANPEKKKFNSNAHNIGTTRMSDTPESGVVDTDCKVHGVENLYVAGSSVFPTSGHANPTLMILALALRLADHLKAKP
jgi:choline dehydrogenase-like flavoprotein